ncbi:hypothetical protein LCGC14_2849050, partial [marine sediment metagenome]
QAESEKTMSEAYKKFIDSAKNLRAEARKAEDPDSAENLLMKASDHASRGNDEELSKVCWVDSGEQFRKKAADTEDPRLAFEIYKHGIINLRKGGNEELVKKSYAEAADKFNKKAIEREKALFYHSHSSKDSIDFIEEPNK